MAQLTSKNGRNRELFGEQRAVSPVIGVILMVAIVVILAAVIGFFVLGLGSEQNTTPQASFSFDRSGGNVIITHDGGDTLQNANVRVLVGGIASAATWSATPITAGTSTTVAATTGQEVRVVYTNDNGQTSTLGSYTVP